MQLITPHHKLLHCFKLYPFTPDTFLYKVLQFKSPRLINSISLEIKLCYLTPSDENEFGALDDKTFVCLFCLFASWIFLWIIPLPVTVMKHFHFVRAIPNSNPFSWNIILLGLYCNLETLADCHSRQRGMRPVHAPHIAT